MRKITANIIYPISSPPIKNAYITVNDNGEIIDIIKYNRNSKEIAGLEYYNGVLIPGFINAHCHLELSHLKGKIEEGKGLNHFINQVQSNRKESQDIIEKSMQKALRYLWSRGVNGLGDVVNSPFGINEKNESPILTQNFIELFNEKNKSLAEVVNHGKYIEHALINKGLKNSPSPHSIYGTSIELLKQIKKEFISKHITSLHFLESKNEINPNYEKAINYLKELNNYEKILLVHNLYLTENIYTDIKSDAELFKKIFWVINPNSNIYINSELPAINNFYKWGMQICLGTDSLASNHSLSILDEMKTIIKYFPEIPFNTIIKWATLNGAKALNFDSLGSFNIGKKPGVLLLSNFNFKNQQINENTEVKRLV